MENAGRNFIETCSIPTTTPSSLLVDVHDRTPVILEAANCPDVHRLLGYDVLQLSVLLLQDR